MRCSGYTLVCVAGPGGGPAGERAVAYLERVARSILGEAVCGREVVRGGSAAEAVLAASSGDPGTGIALATLGRAGVGRLLHRSVTDQEIWRTAGPALVLHPTA